jgi:hypothetical protein
MRTGIGYREDVVRAVAIVAFCSLRVPELRNLPVIGVEVCVSDLAMTASALIHDVELETLFVCSTDCVGGVTIIADRQFLVAFGNEPRMNARFKLIFNAVMALAARRREVLGIDT